MTRITAVEQAVQVFQEEMIEVRMLAQQIKTQPGGLQRQKTMINPDTAGIDGNGGVLNAGGGLGANVLPLAPGQVMPGMPNFIQRNDQVRTSG